MSKLVEKELMKPKSNFPSKLIESAEFFFSFQDPKELPEILTTANHQWVVMDGNWFIALFCLSPDSVKRIKDFTDKGWDPFPGLFTQTPAQVGLIKVYGKKNLFSSNYSENAYAFQIGPNATLIIHNHNHKITGLHGEKVEYKVELAFVVGDEAKESEEKLIDIFESLFKKLHSVWNQNR